MEHLRKASVKELVQALETKEGVRSSKVLESESVRITVSGSQGEKNRYLQSSGPGIVLEVKLQD